MNAYQQLEQIFEKLAYFEHHQAISGWDEAVMMPSGGGHARAKAMATLQSLIHTTLTDPKVGELIAKAKTEKLEDSWEKANLKWMDKTYQKATCLPPELVKQLTEASMHSQQAWRVMRAENNWHDFAPLLEKTLNLVKKSTQIRAEKFNKLPYDVLLDDFFPDITQKKIDPVFTKLKSSLPSIIEEIIKRQKSQKIIMPEGLFPTAKQKQLALELMQAIGFDFNHGRLDESHHPFCGGDPEDVRITTRYNEKEFINAAMAICHETGHARYEQGLPKKWLRQPVGRVHNFGVHESQSLLIEMQACRSREFMNFLAPTVKNIFGDQETFSAENLFHLNTKVTHSLIRVHADEVTYPLHIILRYELEKQLITGDIKVADLPEAWNHAMQQYLGLSTKDNYKDGVMQDVHWPAGLFGYFPSYTLGRLTAAQLFVAAEKAHPEILEQLTQGNFTSLYHWLGDNVHSKASSVDYDELMQEATGEPLNPNYFIEHIKRRYQ